MRRILCRTLDQWTIQMASSFRAGGTRAPHHHREAEKLLNAPDFFPSAQIPAAEPVFSNQRDFHFSSPLSSRWEENNRVFGKLFRAGPDWQSRPTVILLHGWSAELQYRWQFPILARRLTRAGVNTAMFELPYHGHRIPREPGAIQNFISYDLLHMLEATRQALADTQALIAWLARQGSPSVGVWGTSLGAWLAGLLISDHNDGGNSPSPNSSRSPADFAVLFTPVPSVDRAIQELAFCESIRSSLQGASPAGLERLNLTSHLPLLSPERILIVEAQHDVFAPVETVEKLWRTWRQPDIWRLRHGHISVLISPFIMRRIIKWVCLRGYGTVRHSAEPNLLEVRHSPH